MNLFDKGEVSPDTHDLFLRAVETRVVDETSSPVTAADAADFLHKLDSPFVSSGTVDADEVNLISITIDPDALDLGSLSHTVGNIRIVSWRPE